MKKKLIVIGLLVVTLSMLAAGCAQKAPATQPAPVPTTPTPKPTPTPEVKELKIGVILSYTGPASTIFMALRNAMDMQAEEINAAGGITVQGQTYKIILVHEDDELTIDKALTALRKLVYQDNIKFVIGPSIPELAVAVASEREELKVLMFDVSNSFEALRGHGQYDFKPHTSGLLAAANLVRYAAQAYPQVKRYAGFGPKGIAAEGTWQIVKETIDSMPGRFEVAGVTYYEPGTVDFTPLLTGFLRSKPDIIDDLAAPTEDGLLIIKQARDLGYKGVFNIGYAFAKEEALKVMPPEYLHDLLLMGMDWNNPPTPQLADFARRYKAKYGEMPHPAVPYIVDHLPLMVKAIQEANTFDTTQIVKVIESWSSFDTHFGKATWGGLKTVGYNHLVQRADALIHVKSADEWVGALSPPPVVP